MTIQEIKHEFMAFRNGIVADALRSAGQPYGVIFGLQLPQLKEIASKAGKDASLAGQLWEDRNVRESRLLAPFLLEAAEMTTEEAVGMLAGTRTREEVDILVFRLIRFHPQLTEIRAELERMLAGENAPALTEYALVAIDRFME